MWIFFDMFFDVIIECFSWFTDVMTSAGLLDYFVGIVIISIVFTRLVSPLFRSAGSDRSNPRRNKKEE